MAKLSRTQHAVLVKMADGWTLRQDRTMNSLSPWLHRGGLGITRETENIRATTFWAIRNLEFIEVEKDGWPSRTYQLTDTGKRAAGVIF